MLDQQRSYYTYRCKYCGFECFKETPDGMKLPSGQAVTRLGDYGSEGTPTPTAYDEELYEATTISFTAEVSGVTPAYINDSAGLFQQEDFRSDMVIVVSSTSGTNDGTYTIESRGVASGVLTLSSDDSLTTETAVAAGTVTLSRRIYQPTEDATGCGFCKSLNSK